MTLTSSASTYMAAVACIALSLTACGTSDDRSTIGVTTKPGTAPISGAAAEPGGANLEFSMTPDPPRAGRNAIAVMLRRADGVPVTDAQVHVVFSMPAMPSMNMPAMRSESTLVHVSQGRYEGTGELSMGGTWNVAVTASRGSEELATKRLSIVAKE